MITEPLKCLTHAPQFAKFHEHECNGFADSPIGMKSDLAQSVNTIADRQPLEQFTAACLGLLAREHSLPYDLEFDYAERSFDAQHQLIIEVIQIVDLLLVGNQGAEDLKDFHRHQSLSVRDSRD